MHCDHLIFHRHEDLVAWRAHVHCRDSTHVLVCVRLYNGALTYGNATNSCFSKKVWPNKTRFSCCQIWFRWLRPRVSEQITQRSVLLILIRDPKPHAGSETKYSLFCTRLPGKMSQMVARQKHTTHRNRVSTVNWLRSGSWRMESGRRASSERERYAALRLHPGRLSLSNWHWHNQHTHTHTHTHRAEPVCQPLRATYSSCTVHTHTHTHTHTNESLSQAFASHKHHAGTQPEANKAGEVSGHVGQAGEDYGHGASVIHVPVLSLHAAVLHQSHSVCVCVCVCVCMDYLLIRRQVGEPAGQTANTLGLSGMQCILVLVVCVYRSVFTGLWEDVWRWGLELATRFGTCEESLLINHLFLSSASTACRVQWSVEHEKVVLSS